MQLRHRRLLHAHRSRLPLNHRAGPLHQRTAAIRPHKNADRILHQCRTQRPAGGVKPHRQIFSLFKAEKMRGGKHSKLRSPFFPPRAPPFRARKLLQVVEMCSGTGGAMDAAVLDMKHCADLFLFSTTFPVNHLLPPDHKETQPFHPAVQRSADSSSNPRGPTQPHPNPTSQAPPSPTALIQPPKQPHSPTALIQPSEQLPSPTALILSPEQPHSPTALKSQPVRRVLPVDGLCRRGADSWLAEICVASKILTV